MVCGEWCGGVRKREEQAPALPGRDKPRGRCGDFCRNKPYTFVGTGVLDCPKKRSHLHIHSRGFCTEGMRVRCVCVPPHQSAEPTASPSQGEAFLFAFGRCWCKFRGLCSVWMRVRRGSWAGGGTPTLRGWDKSRDLCIGLCRSKLPSLGRGAPWCSRGNKPIYTYIPITLPSDGAISQPSPSRGRGTVATVDEDASLICTTPWSLRRGIVVRIARKREEQAPPLRVRRHPVGSGTRWV